MRSPSNPFGITPFGFYDSDSEFQADAPRAAEFVARKLGWPVVEVELIDKQIYACFEEAITTYGNQVNQFNAREHMMTLQGLSTATSATQRNIVGSVIPQVIKLATDYGVEAQSGGDVEVKRKLAEIDRIVEYTSRMKQELSEGEEGIKYWKATQKNVATISEMVNHLNNKIKNLQQ